MPTTSGNPVIDALVTITQQALSDIHVFDTTPAIPFPGPYPALVFSESEQPVLRKFTGMRGQDGTRPSEYNCVYLQQTPLETGQYNRDAVVQMRTNLRRFVALWSTPAYAQLNGAAIRAGDQILLTYDRQGNFIEYLGKSHIGCYITIAVWEDYLFDTDA